ncbi:MAG: IPT/TIG domain-containing protein [Bacteroidales bacterium]|nr:IPT/TIG domain-containing protein [Bacteroidales bacterium]
MKAKTIIKNTILAICIISLGLLVNSCNEDLFLPDNIRDSITAPEIHSFSPQSGTMGDEITITGRSLSSVRYAFIGGRRTEVAQRFTDYTIVLRLVGTEITGPITLVNNIDATTTAETFVVIDNIPEITSVKETDASGADLTELVDERRVFIIGEQLGAVIRVTFGSDTTIIEGEDTTFNRAIPGRLIDRNDTMIIVEVPYLDVDFGDLAPINFEYMREGQLQDTSVGPFPVNNVFIAPTITNRDAIPEETNPSRVIVIRGTNLNRVHYAFLDGYRDSTWTIISQTRTELRVLVPGFTAGRTAGDLILVHNRNRAEEIVKRIGVVNEGALNFVRHRNVRMQVNRPPGQENMNNFLNADDGQLYGPCDNEIVNIADVTTFFFSISTSTPAGGIPAIVLQNPANSNTQFQNFNCVTRDPVSGEVSSESLPAGTRGARGIRFTRLNPDNVLQRELIDRVLAPEGLDSIYLDMVPTTINMADLVTNSPHWRGSGVNIAPGGGNWDIGDVIVFREYLNHNNGIGGTGGRFGFIHITGVDPGPRFDPENPAAQDVMDRRMSSVTINVWFQRPVAETEEE